MTDVSTYLNELRKYQTTGQATEHGYRGSLQDLFESIEDGFVAVNDAKHQKAGAPDFIVMRGEIPIGFAETKDIDVRLDPVENGEQMGRYRKAFGNLILTNYLEFRRYQDGEHVETVVVAELKGGKIQAVDGTADKLEGLLLQFAQSVAPTIGTPKELATRMAGMTQQIRRVIENLLNANPPSPSLTAQLQDFRETLIPDLPIDQFADMYAQTLAYGLFAARVHGGDRPFTRKGAAALIPQTNPFLRKLFNLIAGEVGGDELDKVVLRLMDALAELLARADMTAILANFGKSTRQEDPIVHFYETFLKAYDPALRESRGVYYTPEPVVSYIVRSVDGILREAFERPDGLADPRTLILDPAAGTGTFLYFIIRQIHDQLMTQGQSGMWDSYVRDHLLPRLFGFELLMAPYAMAHMKLGIELETTGYTFNGDQRLGIYLTNTLDEAVKTSERLGFAGFISEEGQQAAEIKRDRPIMVVVGNPPYSGHSANRSTDSEGNPTWIGAKVRDYFFVDGEPLGERNPKWLQDDYVKFVRFGQWRIEQTRKGVLAFVTNHGYLDNPTFRGMRQQLMSAFSEIYVLNLHGNSKKKETAPDGSPDENVFDIQQGVAIGVFVKREGAAGPAKVYHADLWGKREGKYKALFESDLWHSEWTELTPDKPFYLFVPQNIDLREEHNKSWKITDVAPVNVLGFQTHRDEFAIDFDRNNLLQRISEMRDTQLGDDAFRQRYSVSDNRDWQLSRARKQLRDNKNWEENIINCLYRPFDWRPCFFDEAAMDYPRRELVTHVMHKSNLILGFGRQGLAVNDPEWYLMSVSSDPVDANIFRRGGINLFPLYLYGDQHQRTLFDTDDWPAGKDGRRPNLAPEFVKEMEDKLGLKFVSDDKGDLKKTFGPEDVFDYIYAMFHSPTYRERYAEFLRIDFPRVPITSDKKVFKKLAEKGAGLVDYHLMRDKQTGLSRRTEFLIKGNNVVERGYPQYTDPSGKIKGRVSINSTQYFEGISPDVWEFQIGGYQVLEKWLKDRRGRELSYEDTKHYQRIVMALEETMKIMGEIDGIIPSWPIE